MRCKDRCIPYSSQKTGSCTIEEISRTWWDGLAHLWKSFFTWTDATASTKVDAGFSDVATMESWPSCNASHNLESTDDRHHWFSDNVLANTCTSELHSIEYEPHFAGGAPMEREWAELESRHGIKTWYRDMFCCFETSQR